MVSVVDVLCDCSQNIISIKESILSGGNIRKMLVYVDLNLVVSINYESVKQLKSRCLFLTRAYLSKLSGGSNHSEIFNLLVWRDRVRRVTTNPVVMFRALPQDM